MLHIVIISPIFAVNEQDSINLPFLQLFCRELLKNNIKLSIISEQFPEVDNYLWHGVTVHTLKKTTARLPYKFLRRRRLNKTLEKIHSLEPIHVIHNFWFNILGKISEAFALKYRIKHLITLCGQDVLPENPFLETIRTYSGSLVCPSVFHKEKLLESHPVNVDIIPWGIEDIPANLIVRTIDLIHCGWINAVKNNLQFLEIVAKLRKTGTVKKAVICGGGPMFAELVSHMKNMKLEDIIEIRNSIPRHEVLLLMQQSKVLVHTSRFESFGLVLAEALACNCSVISTPVGIAYENKDIICCHTTGDFVYRISEKLQNFKEDPKEKPNPYPISHTAAEYIKLYKSL